MKDDEGAKPTTRYRIEALAKGLDVLRLFDESVTSLKLRDICDRTGIPMPTAFRVVATLEEGGFVERLADGAIRPGVAVLTLGSAALRGSNLVQVSDSPLRRLADATGETVNLGVLRGADVLYLARIRNADLVTANIQVGSTLPAPLTSMGKLLLAYLPEDDVRTLLEGFDFYAIRGPHAPASLDVLLARLDETRRQGFAIQDEEVAAGLRSVAAPVFAGGTAPIGAVNVAVATTRHSVEDLHHTLLPALQATAEEISLRMRSA